jgi:hypothetical protein
VLLQLDHMLFPILSIKRLDGVLHIIRRIETPEIDAKSIWVGSGYIKRLYTANLAEMMLRNTGAECIGGEACPASQQTKFFRWNDQVKKSRLAANRAIALREHWILGKFHLKPDRAAVATARLHQCALTIH